MEFCEKKQKHCDAVEAEDFGHGDQWDHVALDVLSRFAVSMVTDKRTPEALGVLVADFADRTGHKPPRLVTTDDCVSYERVLLEQYGTEVVVRRKDGQPDGRCRPYKVWTANGVHATVKKTFKCDEVVELHHRLTLGTEEQLAEALALSHCSTTVNTSFIERHNATDRAHNARKARKTLAFSKVLLCHQAVSWWVLLCYNFHFLHAGLSQERGFDAQRKRLRRLLTHRTPAMAMGLTDHAWAIQEILFIPLLHVPSHSNVTSAYFHPWPRPAAKLPTQEPKCPTGKT